MLLDMPYAKREDVKKSFLSLPEHQQRRALKEIGIRIDITIKPEIVFIDVLDECSAWWLLYGLFQTVTWQLAIEAAERRKTQPVITWEKRRGLCWPDGEVN